MAENVSTRIHVIVQYIVGIQMYIVYILGNVTDMLLPHVVAEVGFQSAQHTK